MDDINCGRRGDWNSGIQGGLKKIDEELSERTMV